MLTAHKHVNKQYHLFLIIFLPFFYGMERNIVR
ncbi:unnamed protein product [Brugia timori]|uniref:Uncharacterized protein n=1 Tax=Brugia timori TaxID=42155 RepID=A0A3P7WTY2_9BILA|nr:unnamed protein product [Brugia timori]